MMTMTDDNQRDRRFVKAVCAINRVFRVFGQDEGKNAKVFADRIGPETPRVVRYPYPYPYPSLSPIKGIYCRLTQQPIAERVKDNGSGGAAQ